MDHSNNNNNKSRNERFLSMNMNNINNINTKENENINQNENNNNNNSNINLKQAKTFTKNMFNLSNSKMPGIKNYLNSPPATANPQNVKFKSDSLDFTNKEHLKEFFANKQKVSTRLNSMYKESMNNINNMNANNSVGQRVLIKNSRGGNVEDRFSKTTKLFY